MPAAPAVDFYFGPGSRYSYLASTQIDAIAARTGARFSWRPLFSADLFGRAGYTPFGGEPSSGQYTAAYRNEDVRRWAAFYGVPCTAPTLDEKTWRGYALALIAAEHLSLVEPFARVLFAACFAKAQPPTDDEALNALAKTCGIDDLADRARAPEIAAAHAARLDEAVARGVFGVPSFVTDDQVFWGNDRLVLLEHYLTSAARKV